MKRLGYLDSLRGIAAVYVLIYHAILVAQPQLVVPQWYAPFFLAGGTGVMLFFVVSAFSLCLTWPRHEKSGIPLSSYFISRFFRIAPLFYFMMIVTYIRDIFVYDAWHTPWQVFINLAFIFNFVPQQQEGFVWASWAIGVEFLFYVLFPLFYYAAATLWRRLMLVFVLGLVTVIYFSLLPYLHMDEQTRAGFTNFGLLRFLPVFGIGMVAFDVARRTHELPNARDIGGALVALSILAYAAIIAGYLPAASNIYGQGICYALLLVGLSLNPVGLYVNPLTRFYGRISYSVYLLHPPIVYALSPAYRWIYAARIGKSDAVSFWLSIGLTLAIVTPLAMLTYRFIEAPGIELGKRLIKRAQAKRGIGVASAAA